MNNLLDMEHAKALCCSSISLFFARTPHIHLEKDYRNGVKSEKIWLRI